jgi:hypothetical protein
MAPANIRVKLVSEAAEYVSVSHVVQRDFTLRELVEVMLPVVGADAARVQKIIRVGTVAAGDYRYRWEGLDIAAEELAAILDGFPRSDPSRNFDPSRCTRMRFRRGQETLELPREAAQRKPLFARRSFWEALLDSFQSDLRYSDYSHADKADRYTLALDGDRWEKLRALLPLLKPKSAADRLERLRPEAIEWLTSR